MYLTKPLSVVQFQSRVRAALSLKQAQDEAASLNRHLRDANVKLERKHRPWRQQRRGHAESPGDGH